MAFLFDNIDDTSVMPPIPVLGYFWPDTFGSQCARWGSSLNATLAGTSTATFGKEIKTKTCKLRWPLTGGPEHFVIVIKVNGKCFLVDNGTLAGMPGHIKPIDEVFQDDTAPYQAIQDVKKCAEGFCGESG